MYHFPYICRYFCVVYNQINSEVPSARIDGRHLILEIEKSLVE